MTVTSIVDLIRREGHGPGDRLPSIRQLSAKLGVGRNAVRDGLLEAQSKGFVRIEPRLGVFVEDLDPASRAASLEQGFEQTLSAQSQNLFHLVDARLLVEVELVGKAARNRRPEDLLPLRQTLESVLAVQDDRLALIEADEAFHLGIARLAGNDVLTAFLRTLLGLLRPAKQSLMLTTGDRGQTDREHIELFRCLLAGNAEVAQQVMRDHIAKGRALLLDHLTSIPASGTGG